MSGVWGMVLQLFCTETRKKINIWEVTFPDCDHQDFHRMCRLPETFVNELL